MVEETRTNPKLFSPFISPEEFAAKGYCIKHDFFTVQECEFFLSRIEDYRRARDVPRIRRESRERSLNYGVIDGLKIKKYLPEIQRLYCDVNQTVNSIAGQNLAPLKNTQVGINVNITPPGGEYRWHYDRNKLTGILYLNTVEGGETECYPNYRLSLKNYRYSRWQRLLDNTLQLKTMRGLFGKQVLLKPRQGTFLLMRADKCLHSVRPVFGNKDRINVILAYDAADADFTVDQRLGNYLYNRDAPIFSDPNYK